MWEKQADCWQCDSENGSSRAMKTGPACLEEGHRVAWVESQVQFLSRAYSIGTVSKKLRHGLECIFIVALLAPEIRAQVRVCYSCSICSLKQTVDDTVLEGYL